MLHPPPPQTVQYGSEIGFCCFYCKYYGMRKCFVTFFIDQSFWVFFVLVGLFSLEIGLYDSLDFIFNIFLVVDTRHVRGALLEDLAHPLGPWPCAEVLAAFFVFVLPVLVQPHPPQPTAGRLTKGRRHPAQAGGGPTKRSQARNVWLTWL